MKKIKNLFTEDVQKILTDETIEAIETAIEEKVEEAKVEALEKQDEIYAGKLQVLVSTIDKDHSKKMQRVLEAHGKSNTAKLAKLVKLFKRREEGELRNFKKQIVESVGAFLDEFINESISVEDLQQAVKNKTAFSVLENLRHVLTVDSMMMKESISSAILEGKEEMDKVVQENVEVKKQLKVLQENNEAVKKELFVENKTSKLPEAKKSFVKKALKDKSLKFIEENFDYTIKLFDRHEKNKLQTLKEDALQEREHKPDFVPIKIVTEKVNNDNTDPYVSELSKVRKF